MPRLAIEELLSRQPLDGGAIDAFLGERELPIVEGDRCTFLFRGHADEVWLSHWIVGLPNRLPLHRIEGTDLWYLVMELPAGSRVEYKLELVHGDHHEVIDDPLNPRRAYNPMGQNSVCYATGYEVPDWVHHDPLARQGALEDIAVGSGALGRECPVTLYLPARFRRSARYPLLVVHDGGDYLGYASAKTVLDNLIHRLDVAELVVAFVHPGDRLQEYPDNPAHAAFLTEELLPRLEHDLPLVGQPRGRCLMGSSFGGVAALSVAARYPETYGSLVLQSASLVFTDIGDDHGGGPVFDPVVAFTNRYRANPYRLADRIYMSCGMYEPLITPNRSMHHTLQAAGMDVRYVEARDGHNWENWRDRLRDSLSWLFPGPHKLYYE
jgi:enterochelin esterase-like enzyme